MLQWQPNLVTELSQYFRVILMDNRGCGRSGRSRKFYTMKTYSKDIFYLMEFLAIRKSNFLGHSLGGAILERFAIMYPEKVDKLVFISPDIGSFKRKLPKRSVLNMLFRGLKTDALSVLIHGFCIHKNSGKHCRTALDFIERVFRYYPMKKKDYRKQLIAAMCFNTKKKITQVYHKSLILTGEFDEIVLPENAVRLARILPHSTLSIIHGCGHLFVYDQIKSLLNEIYEFLT